MPEKHLYEYAVIRFVPKVEREEFLNIGIVLFSKQARYLNAIYVLNEQKLRSIFYGSRYGMPKKCTTGI